MKKEFIAYQGEEFTIEWYYDDNGKSRALEYYEDLPLHQKAKLEFLFRMLGDTGKIRSEEKFRHEGDQIYAFKPIPDRFLCFFHQGSKVIVTNAFEKKQDKMPLREKEKALRLKDDYIKRCNGGSYYD
jgi:phage-related protein